MSKPNNNTTLYNSGSLERDHHPGEEQGLGAGALHTALYEKGKEQMDFEISAGSCDVPSESREQEEEGALMRQGQAASSVQERTNVVEDMLTRTMEDEVDKVDKVDKVDLSRLQPRISSTIQELQKRVGGGSGKKRGRPKKVQPELPQCFPRIDKIITAMGGSKTKRKR